MIAMTAADLRKLVRRRGVVWASGLFTIGVVLLLYVIRSTVGTDPAGGAGGYEACVVGLSVAGLVAATMIGAAAGAGDHTSGVFRDLVATGCPRWRLFASRTPAALALLAGYVVVAFVLGVGGAHLFAASRPLPSGSAQLHQFGWVALVLGLQCAVACGLASLAGSRSWVIGALLIFQFPVSHILGSITELGVVRRALYPLATERFAPSYFGDHALSMSGSAAWATIAGSLALAMALGAWRVSTRDA